MKIFKLRAILYSIVFYVFTVNSVLAFVPMAMLLEDTTLEEDSTAQHTFAASDVTLTINGGVTFGTASGNSQIDTASTNSSIIIDEDALIRGTFNGSKGIHSTGLYISNDDLEFIDALRFTEPQKDELKTCWRTHVLCWAAKQSVHVKGDFFEFGCYKDADTSE